MLISELSFVVEYEDVNLEKGFQALENDLSLLRKEKNMYIKKVFSNINAQLYSVLFPKIKLKKSKQNQKIE